MAKLQSVGRCWNTRVRGKKKNHYNHKLCFPDDVARATKDHSSHQHVDSCNELSEFWFGLFFSVPSSSLHSPHHAPDQLHHEQLHTVMAATWTAQWHHSGLWAALLREGKATVCEWMLDMSSWIVARFVCSSAFNCPPPKKKKKSKFSRISVSRVPWVDNMFPLCVHSISPTVLWFLLLMKWIGWPLLQAHSAQCCNLSCCENALRLGGESHRPVCTHTIRLLY